MGANAYLDLLLRLSALNFLLLCDLQLAGQKSFSMPNMKASPMTLSVIIPAYNELETLQDILDRVNNAAPMDKEIILVDDFSTDGTRELLSRIENESRFDVKVLYHEKNHGKGAALRTGIAAATGDFVIIQDADLEYDPSEYASLLKPLTSDLADVVYGSRFTDKARGRFTSLQNHWGNKILTKLSNLFTHLGLTDMETCYKVFRREIIKPISIEENRFGFEPEVTAKIAATGCRVLELPISYNPRSYAEGKKIGWRDAARAVWCILKYRIKAGKPKRKHKN